MASILAFGYMALEIAGVIILLIMGIFIFFNAIRDKIRYKKRRRR